MRGIERFKGPDDSVEESISDDVPSREGRKAWDTLSVKPQMGLSIFLAHGGLYEMPMYIQLLHIRGGGERVTLFFHHMTVEIIGKGVDNLADRVRRQVCSYIQEQHVDPQFGDREPHYVLSVTPGPPREPFEGE